MTLRQIILKPVAKLGALHATLQLRDFLAAHERTRARQDEFLTVFLGAHAKTDFGRDHKLDKVRTYEEFKAAVPITNYHYIKPYMHRLLQGQTNALLPDNQSVLMFSMTSGTTGEPKHIPVTPRFLADIRRGWNMFGVNVLNQNPTAWLRPLIQISSSTHEQSSPTGKPCGAISGLLAQTQKKIVRWMYVVPRWVTNMHDPASRYYTILRHSIDRDVAFITTANPSSTIKLIETGQAECERLIRDIRDGSFSLPGGQDCMPAGETVKKFRPNPGLARKLEAGISADGKLLPKHFWNLAFLTNWTGGTLHLYLRRLRELFPNVPIHDIGLLASEGRFSVPLEGNTPSGVAEITSNFMEFIPADQRENENPQTLRADELTEGEEYFLVVTNWAGLYRYNMDDRIRVTGFRGQSPEFEFLSRGLHTANITGEKITEHQVVASMRLARRQMGCHVERFVLQGRFSSTADPYYELRLELSEDTNPASLAECMDQNLAQMNIEYASKREGGRLGPIRPVVLPHGTLEAAEHQAILNRRGRSEQYKHQYLMTDVVEDS